jgi:hypothetical protein
MASAGQGSLVENNGDYGRTRLNLWRTMLGDAAWLRRKRTQYGSVNALDPDIASYRSFSLSHKIHMQRERNFQQWLETQGGWLERWANGEDDEF